jgi:hypothetical protein
MKTYGAVDIWLHPFLTSAQDGGRISLKVNDKMLRPPLLPGKQLSGSIW